MLYPCLICVYPWLYFISILIICHVATPWQVATWSGNCRTDVAFICATLRSIATKHERPKKRNFYTMNIWLIIYRVSCVVLIAILIIGIINIFLPKIHQNTAKQNKIMVMEEENRATEDMIKQLRKKQEQFVSDPKYVERIAREKLGKAKQGETIFRFNDRNTNDVH